MDRDHRLSVVVGLFAVGALALFAAAVLSLTAQRGPWTPRYRLVAYFTNVQGLIDGAPVRLAGKDVGTVERVSFGRLGGDRPPVRVAMLLDAEVRDRIRDDSRATIGTIGLLGDKYVELSMGSLTGRVLENGMEVPAITPPDLPDVVQKATQALDGIGQLAANLNGAAEQFNQSKGAARVAETARSMSEIVARVEQGHGLLHSLVYDEYKGGGIENVNRALATLSDLLGEVAHGHGLLHDLIYEPPAKQGVLAQADLAGERMNRILAGLESGQGTLGLLLTDPTLYERLDALLGGAQRSLLVRSMIRLSAPGEEPKEAP